MKRRLSYSQITTWQRCRKRWHWNYIEDLVSRKKGAPLLIGDLTHRLRESFLKGELSVNQIQNLIPHVKELYPNEDDFILTDVALTAAGLLNAYIEKYEEDGTVKIISTETHLEKDMGSFLLYARLDGIATVKGSNGLWREELKTSSRTDSAFLQGQNRGLQTGISMWLMEELMTEEVRGTVFTQLVKTKVPQCHIKPVVKSDIMIKITKEAVRNHAREIEEGLIYQSGQCFAYNRECSYMILCKNDTQRNREEFFQSGGRKQAALDSEKEKKGGEEED